MNAFAGLHEELADLPWHQDPRDRDPRDEASRQQEFLRRARIVCPAVDIVAIPNAGRRTRWEAAQRRREGMRAGALDLVCTWNHGVSFIEFKNGRDGPDANQRERLNRLHRWGHHVALCRTAEGALAFLRAAGAPFLTREGL